MLHRPDAADPFGRCGPNFILFNVNLGSDAVGWVAQELIGLRLAERLGIISLQELRNLKIADAVKQQTAEEVEVEGGRAVAR